MMLTDTHCHLASHQFSRDEIGVLIERAQQAGVRRLVSLATDLEDLAMNLDLAAHHPCVRVCLGIHPCEVHAVPDGAVAEVAGYLSDPRVCAVGETGLDYYHPAPDGWDETGFRERQRLFLDQHFQAAGKAGLNVVIHTRDRSGDQSFHDALEIYRRYADKVRAVFHCFIGTEENARKVIELGGLVSFGGVVTFKNAVHVQEVAGRLPLGTFMLETDSPYLAPVPYRGKRNEPAHVRLVADFISEKHGLMLAELAMATENAANGFFRWGS
jgi:TatD DNase family protein